MDKEELYEKVIELLERVRELEQIIKDDRDDLDDTKKRLSDAEAENQSLRKENTELRKALDNYKDLGTAELPPLGSAEKKKHLSLDWPWEYNVRLTEESAMSFADRFPDIADDALDEIQSLKEENAKLRNALKEMPYLEPFHNDLAWLETLLNRYDKANERMHDQISEYDRGPVPIRLLSAFLEEKGITPDECAKLCGVHQTTVSRLSRGYRCRKSTFDKVVRGLGLTDEEATELGKSLTKKQRKYGMEEGRDEE